MNISYQRIICLSLAFLCCVGQVLAGTTIWGVQNIAKLNPKAKAPFNVYLQSYKQQKSAELMVARLKAKGYQVKIKKNRRLYMVCVGPLYTPQGLNKLAKDVQYIDKVDSNIARKKFTRSELVALKMPTQVEAIAPCKDFALKHDKWFVSVAAGVIYPSTSKTMTVNNGSNFPAPLNHDKYSTKQGSQETVLLTAGKRMSQTLPLIDHYTLSGRLQYLTPNDIGNSITQYSLPQFRNYQYHWKYSALALTADSKLNIGRFSSWSPYVNLGLGVSFNRTESYKESALSNVTPRLSPGFTNHTQSQFTYHGGAGLDFNYSDNWLVFAGYEYASFGHFSSGAGRTTWSQTSLKLASLQTSALLLGVSYLID